MDGIEDEGDDGDEKSVDDETGTDDGKGKGGDYEMRRQQFSWLGKVVVKTHQSNISRCSPCAWFLK
jgi:hypothetical protein